MSDARIDGLNEPRHLTLDEVDQRLHERLEGIEAMIEELRQLVEKVPERLRERFGRVIQPIPQVRPLPQPRVSAPILSGTVAVYYSCGCCDSTDGTGGSYRCPAHVGIRDMEHPERP